MQSRNKLDGEQTIDGNRFIVRDGIVHIKKGEASAEIKPPPTRFFIAYKRHMQADRQLAQYLYQFLTSQGHQVFIDQAMRSGTKWLSEIDRQIRRADFLVVLLSAESAQSEMVQSEVSRAYNYKQRNGKPTILPVHLNYEGMLPYAIDIYLNPLQYVVWQRVQDNQWIGYELLAAAAGISAEKPPFQPPYPTSSQQIVDGVATTPNEIPKPQATVDPRLLELGHQPARCGAPIGGFMLNGLRINSYGSNSNGVAAFQRFVPHGRRVRHRYWCVD